MPTKYPIILAHGIGCRDDQPEKTWGRIPEALRADGNKVYFGGQDAWGSVENNARMLKERLLSALASEHAEKANLICHSKGGLEARYLAFALGMRPKIASITTINTPHRGNAAADRIFAIPGSDRMLRLIGFFVCRQAKRGGDRDPDFSIALWQTTQKACAAFDRSAPDDRCVYCQSYASRMRFSLSDTSMWLQNAIMRYHGGDNDGIVCVESAKWGVYRGLLVSNTLRGVSHIDVVDRRGGRYRAADIPAFYVSLARELADMGY